MKVHVVVKPKEAVLDPQGLPEAAVTNLAIHRLARLLRAATHGRGVWEIPLDITSTSDPDIYLRVNYADTADAYPPE